MGKNILKYILHPSFILIKMDNKNIIRLNDKIYLKLLYKKRTDLKLHLNKPLSYNEKVQWLKLYDRKEIYTTMVDKYEAKRYVAKIIGEEYIIPTIGVYDKFDDIDFDKLPNQFVIKCTHDSGGLVIVKNKKKIDINYMRNKFEKLLKRNYFYHTREWPYKNVKPRIIIEKYMVDKSQNSLKDYKFFCFDGKPRLMYLAEGLENHSTAGISFYDMNFKITDCKRKDYRLVETKVEKPKNFDKMKKFAAILSKGIPHLRVDFYEVNNHLYFGELTFSTCSGFVPFEDEKWNKILGDYITLPSGK